MAVPITKEMKEWFKNKTPEEIVDSAFCPVFHPFIDPDFEKKYGDMFEFQDSQSSSRMPESAPAPNPIIRLIQRMRARFK